jgi:hypothetical protein
VAVCSADAAATAEVNGDVEQTVAAGTTTEPVAHDPKPAETTAVAALSLSIQP